MAFAAQYRDSPKPVMLIGCSLTTTVSMNSVRYANLVYWHLRMIVLVGVEVTFAYFTSFDGSH
jgi:hypothetical protein